MGVSDNDKVFLLYPAHLAVSNLYLCPVLQTVVAYLYPCAFMQEEEIIAALGWSALDGNHRRHDDARIMLAHLVLLVQSAHIAQDAEQQEEDGCKESAFAQRDAVGNQEQYQHQQGQNKQGDACPGPLAEAEQTGQAVEDVENHKVMLGCDAVNGLLTSQLEVGLYVVVCWIELESTLKP